jgi:hypothetical protein
VAGDAVAIQYGTVLGRFRVRYLRTDGLVIAHPKKGSQKPAKDPSAKSRSPQQDTPPGLSLDDFEVTPGTTGVHADIIHHRTYIENRFVCSD